MWFCYCCCCFVYENDVSHNCVVDNRARLSNMVVTGDGKELYKDASNKEECFDTFPNEGLDVCSDVIAIPVHGSSAQNLNISTADYLTMCEVEVFAGMVV